MRAMARPHDWEQQGDLHADEVEEVDAVPVVEEAGPRSEPGSGSGEVPVVHASPQASRGLAARGRTGPIAQAAVVAVTGVAAGAVALAVARHRAVARRPIARRPRPAVGPGFGPVVATRRFVVDVHLRGE